MADRVELNGDTLENIVGGAFHYNYNSDGTMTCRVDGDKTYNCSPMAKDMISIYILQNKGCSLQDVINYATSQNLFW